MFGRKPAHEHEMKPIRTQPAGSLPMPGAPREALVPATIILSRCACGAFGSVVIVGSWSLADLLGITEREAVEQMLKGV